MVIILVAVCYLFFVLLQYALFNPIIFAVMLIIWIKMSKTFSSIITRVLDNGRKKKFKSYIRKIKELEWLQKLKIEISENEEGKWVEIHLNITTDERKK